MPVRTCVQNCIWSPSCKLISGGIDVRAHIGNWNWKNKRLAQDLSCSVMCRISVSAKLLKILAIQCMAVCGTALCKCTDIWQWATMVPPVLVIGQMRRNSGGTDHLYLGESVLKCYRDLCGLIPLVLAMFRLGLACWATNTVFLNLWVGTH